MIMVGEEDKKPPLLLAGRFDRDAIEIHRLPVTPHAQSYGCSLDPFVIGIGTPALLKNAPPLGSLAVIHAARVEPMAHSGGDREHGRGSHSRKVPGTAASFLQGSIDQLTVVIC